MTSARSSCARAAADKPNPRVSINLTRRRRRRRRPELVLFLGRPPARFEAAEAGSGPQLKAWPASELEAR